MVKQFTVTFNGSQLVAMGFNFTDNMSAAGGVYEYPLAQGSKTVIRIYQSELPITIDTILEKVSNIYKDLEYDISKLKQDFMRSQEENEKLNDKLGNLTEFIGQAVAQRLFVLTER
jgi:hypothetical protein